MMMMHVLAAGVLQVAMIGAGVVAAVLLIVMIARERVRSRREAHEEPGVGLIEREDHSVREPEVAAREAVGATETAVDIGGAAEQSDTDSGDTTAADVQKLIESINAITGSSDAAPEDEAAAATAELEAFASQAAEQKAASDSETEALVSPASLPTEPIKPDPSTVPTEPMTSPASLPAREEVQFASDEPEPEPAPATKPEPEPEPEFEEDDGNKYDLLLQDRVTDAGDRLDVIRIIREVSGSGLFEAMKMTDSASAGSPGVILAGALNGPVRRAHRDLQAANATVSIEPAADRTPAPVTPPPAATEEESFSDEQLQELAAQARVQPGQKKRKTFAEYEEDRRKELERREKEKAERQKAYRERLEKEVFFVGRGVSAPLYLKKHTFDGEKLGTYGLPRLGSAEDVASAIGITPRELRWLCYHREDATTEHYHRFTIPKRSGGDREISSPKPLLRKAQKWVLENVLAKVSTHDAAHGFVGGRSTKSNAEPHLRAAAIIKLDVVDFFPSITFPRVKGLLQKSLGFGEAAATVMALVCTEPPRVTADYDGDRFRVAVGERQLPQGACTSPAITNIICRRLDSRLAGLSKKFGWTYTRYADDITLSGPTGDRKVVGQIMGGAQRILKDEGFAVHRDKIGVFRAGRQQRVTGIVVNEKLSLDRKSVRAFRALLHDTLQNGPDKANRGRHDNFLGYLQGYAAYLHMVDAEKAKPYREKVDEIRKKYFS